MNDVKRDSPSFHRNIEPITQKLHEILSKDYQHILEIGSGSGQHAARFSKEFPAMKFQPTDYDAENLASINSWCEDRLNVLPAIKLDVTQNNWFASECEKFDALFCFNVIHITPWEVTQTIFNHGSKYMKDTCQIMFYGPFKVNGKQTSASNEEFENWLKEKDNSYGIRDIADIELEAKLNGFKLHQGHAMPANNFLNVFSRA